HKSQIRNRELPDLLNRLVPAGPPDDRPQQERAGVPRLDRPGALDAPLPVRLAPVDDLGRGVLLDHHDPAGLLVALAAVAERADPGAALAGDLAAGEVQRELPHRLAAPADLLPEPFPLPGRIHANLPGGDGAL